MAFRSRSWSRLRRVKHIARRKTSRWPKQKAVKKVFISLSTTQKLLKILMAALGLSPDKYESFKHQLIFPKGVKLEDIKPQDRATLAKVHAALFGQDDDAKEDCSWHDLNWAWNYFTHTYNHLFQLVGIMSWEQLEMIIGTFNSIPLLEIAKNQLTPIDCFLNCSNNSIISSLATAKIQKELPHDFKIVVKQQARPGLYRFGWRMRIGVDNKLPKKYQLEEGLSYNIQVTFPIGSFRSSDNTLSSCIVSVRQDDVYCLTKTSYPKEPSLVWVSIDGARCQQLHKKSDNYWASRVTMNPAVWHGAARALNYELWLDFNGKTKGETTAAHQLSSLYYEKELADVEFLLPENASIFRGHAACLAIRSPVFAAILHDQNDKLKKEIVIKDMDSKTFKILLKYINTGELVQPVDVNTAKLLCQAATRYQIDNLREDCVDLLLSSVSHENAIELLIWADCHRIASLKKHAALKIISELA